ncbi:MAG TPA: hypothetical protein PK587_09185 [Syntrophales bacterium]|nr:hypothetical protein [Syntrophales bacterium]
MKIFNRHDRIIPADQDTVGGVLDSLSGPEDALWAREVWPPMVLKPELKVGATGGHGPVKYRVSEYVPGRRAAFQFEKSGLLAGVDGRHYFEVVPRRGHVIIRHVLEGDCGLDTWLKWALVVRPLHNTVIEDAFDKVESRFSGKAARRSGHGPWVRFLRWVIARQRRRPE